MSTNRNRFRGVTHSRTYRIMLLKELYPPYWDDGDAFYRPKGWRNKRRKKQIMHFEYRMYRTWKHNRKTKYKMKKSYDAL